MKILFLSQLVPYPIDAGPKVRSYHVLQYLAAAGHEITLVAFCRENDTADAIHQLSKYCWAVHTVLIRRNRIKDGLSFLTSQLSRRPFLILRDNVAEMRRLLKKLMSNNCFDAIHADQLWMAQYALGMQSNNGAQRNPKTVLDQHNAVYLIPQRLAAETGNLFIRAALNLESKRLARYETSILDQFEHVVWVTSEDQTAVHQKDSTRISDQLNEHIIPICIDSREKAAISRHERPCRITFLGGLHWPPNAQGVIWFAKQVFPRIKAKLPEATLTVIGKNPPKELYGDGIEVMGYVPELKVLLAETGAFIVPLQAGGGMRVKILDSWSWGLPVVSTTIGAEGLDAQDGVNILIADDPSTFASATIRLLTDPISADQLIQNGRKTVTEKYDWRVTYSAWDEIYPV